MCWTSVKASNRKLNHYDVVAESFLCYGRTIAAIKEAVRNASAFAEETLGRVRECKRPGCLAYYLEHARPS
jgi:predicted RNA-binding Zn ribbon-like protein